MDRKTEKVLGYDVDLLSFQNAVDFVLLKIKKNEGMHIVTINPEIIEMGNKDEKFKEILKQADLTIPDGSGIKLALKLKKIKQEQIPGIDFSKEIINHCEKDNIPLALIGAKEDVIQKTSENLKKEFPNLNLCYLHNGYFKENEEIINELATKKPKVVLVALGAPKQDFFIKSCKEKIPNVIYIGVGGSFDVWAGYVERAPKFFRLIGCEWLYRTIKQPERFKRIYKTLPMFLFKAIMESIIKRG